MGRLIILLEKNMDDQMMTPSSDENTEETTEATPMEGGEEAPAADAE